MIDDFSAYTKVAALTANNVSSMPMWAHYSNNHSGFCVAYDMKSNIELSSCVFPVQYTNQRIDITTFMDLQAQKLFNEIERQTKGNSNTIALNDLSLVYLPLLFVNLKHVSWSYENEFRCTIAAKSEIVPYFFAKPKEILVGMKCAAEYKNRLIDIAHTLQIPIYKMMFDETAPSFDLLPKEI